MIFAGDDDEDDCTAVATADVLLSRQEHRGSLTLDFGLIYSTSQVLIASINTKRIRE